MKLGSLEPVHNKFAYVHVPGLSLKLFNIYLLFIDVIRNL